jgi:hypothetical protein
MTQQEALGYFTARRDSSKHHEILCEDVNLLVTISQSLVSMVRSVPLSLLDVLLASKLYKNTTDQTEHTEHSSCFLKGQGYQQ